jgi:hypothetical protein
VEPQTRRHLDVTFYQLKLNRVAVERAGFGASELESL